MHNYFKMLKYTTHYKGTSKKLVIFTLYSEKIRLKAFKPCVVFQSVNYLGALKECLECIEY